MHALPEHESVPASEWSAVRVISEAGQDPVPRELLTRLLERKLIPFLGAGCSVADPSRIPPAGRLAEALIARGAGSEGQALEDIAEEAWTRGGWQDFVQLLPVAEWRARRPNLITRVVAELCKETLISQILTTNWDVLIEAALSQIGQPFAKVVDAQSLEIEPAGTVTLIKLNGCIDRPEFIKARRTDIESQAWLDEWIDAVFEVLVRTNSMLFAGYSGASRAATTTVARLVDADERHSGDFIVDRLQPDEIAASSESGALFIGAIHRFTAFAGEATDFFAALRTAVYPLLLADPVDCARSMAGELLGPTALGEEEFNDLIEDLLDVFKAAGAAACQSWLLKCFGSFPDCEHVDPYVPLKPNADELGKCLLVLVSIRWAGRLDDPASGLDFTLEAVAGGVSTRLPCRIVVGHPRHRRDVAARAAVSEFAREHRETPRGAAIGVAFGGIGGVDTLMRNFSIARGEQIGNAAREGAVVAWIDGDVLLAEFGQNADGGAIQRRIGTQIDTAAALLLGVDGE